MRYCDHIEPLTALVSYLALTKRKSRTPGGLAHDLGLDEGVVKSVVSGFPGIFRKSRNRANNGPYKDQHFYTLQMRYATRYRVDKKTAMDPLPPDYVVALFDMISRRSSQELTQQQVVRQNRLTLIGAWIAAGAAAVAALIATIGQVMGS